MTLTSPAITLPPRSGPGLRAALSLLAAAGLAQPAAADIYSWNTGNGNWSIVNNWSPIGQPFGLDTARIGDLPGVANATVSLNVHATVSAMQLQDGMTFRTTNRHFTVLGQTSISGQNTVGSTLYPSTLRVETGAWLEGFLTDDLSLTNGGRLVMASGTLAEVQGVATIDAQSSISGHGDVNFSGGAGAVLVNNGEIRPGVGGLTLRSHHGGSLDLDGASGNGAIIIDTQDGSGLMVVEESLTDPFSGEIHLTSNSELTMSLSQPWTADASSSITVEGILDLEPRPAAVLFGSSVTLAGDITVGGFAGHLRVVSLATLASSANVSIGTEDRAVFASNTTIDGGAFTLAQGASLEFLAATYVNGGTFNTVSTTPSDGVVGFFGWTRWAGNATINGVASQHDDAEVSGTTTVTADVFNIDGDDGVTTWDIRAAFTINADAIDAPGQDPRFNGTLNIAGGLPPRLTVNLTDPSASWTMAGTMNLANGTGLPEERVFGSPMLVHGSINVESGKVRIWADTTYSSYARTDIPQAAAILYMAGDTLVQSGATFTGLGTLQNTPVGTISLDNGASLGTVGLVNQGVLAVGPSGAGAASVDRFQNSAQATWRVSIAGDTPGTEHDLLIVSGGTATLAGAIEVEVASGFAPQIGDEFTVLTALSGVSGVFAANPVSVTPAGTYGWTVVYNPNTVILRLTGFEPAACYANCDGSTTEPVLNVSDFACFLNRFAAGDSYANCDESTVAPVLNVRDFSCFLNAFAAGCS